MEDVKGKFKVLLKKANSTFSSSSSSSRKFKGQGRVIGSSDSNNTIPPPRADRPVLKANPSVGLPEEKRLPERTSIPRPHADNHEVLHVNASSSCSVDDGFDPFHSLITSGKRSTNGHTVDMFECPVCSGLFPSAEDVSAHVEICLEGGDENSSAHLPQTSTGDCAEKGGLETCMRVFVSGNPPEGSLEIVLRLFRNVVRETGNEKYRRIRTGNPKIRESICDVRGGVDLMGCVGFKPVDEEGETWLVMEQQPSDMHVILIKRAIALLESAMDGSSPPDEPPAEMKSAEPGRVDRQVRVFFVSPESAVEDTTNLPSSFHSLSVEELRRESGVRRKKVEESRLLIHKSLKEKQAKASRRRYRTTTIRVQFPDGIVLQGVFSSTEQTTVLYEFVGSALKQTALEFELLHPMVTARRVIPEGRRTLEDEDLLPSALIKFKPLETDSIAYTGLADELLRTIEPANLH